MGLVAPVLVEAADSVGGVHFIAIGGAGMSGIAAAYADLGVAVSGSDRDDSQTLQDLAGLGITTHVGHSADHLGDSDTVVVSSAIPDDNPELVEARRRGLRVWHRSAALAGLMLGRLGVAVSGTHGKTTTTGMIASMLLSAGFDPGYVIGSPLAVTGRSSHLGAAPPFVVEADESDGSFLQYPAKIVVITNVEADHLDNWGSAERYREGFVSFGSQPGVGQVVISADDAGAREVSQILRTLGRSVLTFGEAADSDIRLDELSFDESGSRARLFFERDSAVVSLTAPGRHNLHNAAAAVAVGLALDAGGLAELCLAVSSFGGTRRRFEPVGEVSGVRVFDDYAHHPTEVKALIAAARPMVGQGRLVVCFQPHLYSRTVEFATDFADVLVAADVLVVCDVYPAREQAADFPGVTGRLVADAVSQHGGEVTYVDGVDEAASALAEIVRVGDLVLTVGAGNVTRVGPLLVEKLAGR